ncbi:partitioning defective 3 homolog B-like [Seriola dumerili]|uniref:partitioning defective 3 homolog B-like n=1 Tax=Seriola dumerili TaxID=41447 RepID=UPI000BBE8441|nr:partitioning defective 3 homolog B-like [Seriola dumerili]
MKVTVTFGDTAVVVPCKAGWTVRDLVEQATRRYRRILEQHGERAVKTHHLEYAEGGILDMDDMLSDLVDDRDKLVAVFSEVQHRRTDSPRENKSSYSSAAPSPEPLRYYPHMQFQEPTRGEIEVNEAILKANTPLLVRSSSDSALAPPHEKTATPPPDHHSNASPEPEINHVLKGALDRLTTDNPPAKMSPVNFGTLTRTVEFLGDRGPLGIHVVPYCSSLSGRTLGLHIKGIEENSRSKRENIFQEDECIVQINDTPLQDKTFTQSQEVFRQAMTSSAVCLEVLPVANKLRYEKSLIGHLFTGDGKESSAKAKSPMVVRAKADSQPEPRPDPKLNTKLEVRRPDTRAKTPEPAAVNTPSVEIQSGHGSLERVSPAPPARGASSSPTRSQSPLASRSPALPGLANLTSKKGGKRIKIDLKKGAEGLGFTVVTRDSSAHAPGPILVKNILPRGAAVNDGRLQPGDRILEVNGVDMTGRSQEELVGMLRSTKQGENVCVVVARQEDIFLPRELKGEDSNSVVLEDGREQLMYEIPLNETGSAGLGVSLKGNKSRETGEDLGIFIKSIIHGGAAHKDGRLSINDQMIAVNGESLLGRSNHAAMETLRRSMSSEGNARGTIQLVVLRAPRQTQQMASANPAASTATNVSNSHQSNPQASSSNQVRVRDACHQLQPPPPRRSSSLLPALRRRASEPLPHSHRQRHTQRPGETHTRYTYGFNQRERRSGYTFGFTQRDREHSDEEGGCVQNDVYRPSTRYEFGFVSHSQTLSNLNRDRYEYGYPRGHTHSRMPADTQGHTVVDNTRGRAFVDAQGNTHGCKSRHARSRTLDTIHSQDGSQGNSYTENIRAMAGQMYGDPPTHSRIPTRKVDFMRCPSHCLISHSNASFRKKSLRQEPRGHDAYQKPSGASRPPNTESSANAASHIPMTANNYTHGNSRNALYPAAITNGSYGHYGNEDEELEEGFPPPPSPGAVEEMNRNLPPIPPHNSEFQMSPHMAAAFYSQLADDEDNVPRNRASKSMDMVADESNVGSLVGQRNEPSAGGALGPTLGLWKSSSLESLQTAVSEAKQSHSQAQVPFHRPRPHMVRGRGCNQSFRIAIDKSYDGPSEDDDDLSEQSSGHETPASSSSRQGLDADDGKKKKKPKDRKKDKKIKGKKKTDDSVEDLDKKTKKKGFGLLRFGKKKEDKSKEAAKASKSKLEALSEEEVDRIPDNRDGYDPRYTEIHSGHVTPDPASLPDVEDDDSDPNYARINNFRQPPSPQSFISRTPSPAATTAGHHLPQASSEELDGLYAKVNKPRHPAAVQSQHHTQADSDPRYQGLRKEHQQPRAAPVYEELDAARRRVLENDPHRMAPRGGESRPVHRYEEADRQYHTHPRRDPYDYPTHSRPMPRESAPYPIHYQDPLISSHPGRVPLPQSGTHSQQASSNPRYYPSSPHMGQQHRTMVRQDVPPSPTAGHRGRHYYEAAGGRAGRYTSLERQPVGGERYTSPERYAYRDERQPDPRRKNPVIGAV